MKSFVKYVALSLATAAIAATVSGTVGFHQGVNHAISGMEVYAVECYDPADPDESQWIDESGEVYDMRVLIELDGETYEHGLTQC